MFFDSDSKWQDTLGMEAVCRCYLFSGWSWKRDCYVSSIDGKVLIPSVQHRWLESSSVELMRLSCPHYWRQSRLHEDAVCSWIQAGGTMKQNEKEEATLVFLCCTCWL